MDVRMPDGTVVRNVPEGTTKAELSRRYGLSQQQAAPPREMGTPPPLPQSRNTGFGSQVSQALARSGMDQRQSVPIPTEGEFRQGFRDFGVGVARGVPAGAVGLPGDVMGLANAGLSAVGAPQMPRPWNTTEAANAMFGAPANNLQALGQNMGALAGPSVGAQVVKGVASSARELAGMVAPAMTEGVKAGYAGGPALKSFADNLRHGGQRAKETVEWAKSALGKMYAERSAAYRANMAAMGQNPAPLPFDAIDDAVNDAASIGTYKGKVISEGAEGALVKIRSAVDDWKQSGLNTAEDLDKLKQLVGNIAKDSNVQPHTPAAVVVDKVYGAIKDTVVKHDPNYATAMREYMEASEELDEISRSLSLGHKATQDTSLRKLLSVFRNNANTNYGNRVESAARLGQLDERLLPALAGQELSTVFPRGIFGQAVKAGGAGALYMDPTSLPRVLGGLAVTSPRVGGEAALLAGRMARGLSNLNPLKNVTLPGGGASVGGIDPRLIASMTPQMLNQLLFGSRAPAQQ